MSLHKDASNKRINRLQCSEIHNHIFKIRKLTKRGKMFSSLIYVSLQKGLAAKGEGQVRLQLKHLDRILQITCGSKHTIISIPAATTMKISIIRVKKHEN